MRCRVLFFAAILLAGCAADPSDLRVPETPSEWAAVNAQLPRVATVSDRLWAANSDLCRLQRCLKSNVNYSPRIGAFAGKSELFFSTGLLDRLKSQDEVAHVIAHEWGHQVLQHRRSGYGAKAEADADCFGAVAMARAGYSILEARRVYSEVAANVEAGQNLIKLTGLIVGAIPEASEHPSAAQRVTALNRIALDIAAYGLRGETVDIAAFAKVCGFTL